jgi:hypothetical protein
VFTTSKSTGCSKNLLARRKKAARPHPAARPFGLEFFLLLALGIFERTVRKDVTAKSPKPVVLP